MAESERCWSRNKKIKLSCVFIEKKKEDFKNLRNTLRIIYPESENERWFVYNSNYIDIYNKANTGTISELTDLIGRPTLFFIDPIGFKNVPLTIVQNMMSKKSCEVLITLMVENIKRHRNSPSVMKHFKEMFGITDLIRLDDICRNPRSESLIAEYYEERLINHSGANIKFTRKFEITPTRRDVILYYLVFGSNHRAGLNAMYTTMRAISKNPDFSFRGKRDGQMSLEYFIDDPLRDIKEWVYSLPLTIANFNTILNYVTQSKNTYLVKDVRAAVVKLIQEGRLEFIPPDEKAKKKGVIGKRYFMFNQM